MSRSNVELTENDNGIIVHIYPFNYGLTFLLENNIDLSELTDDKGNVTIQWFIYFSAKSEIQGVYKTIRYSTRFLADPIIKKRLLSYDETIIEGVKKIVISGPNYPFLVIDLINRQYWQPMSKDGMTKKSFTPNHPLAT